MMTSHWAQIAIAAKRLKVFRFEDLNDPFELLGSIATLSRLAERLGSSEIA